MLVELINNLKIKNENVAYIGDDVNDLDAMNQVGVRVAVSDAVKEVCGIADYICANKGGEAAVREFIDLLLQIRKELGSEA